ncbi:MAG: sulfatase [Polyangiaceae bacterium]
MGAGTFGRTLGLAAACLWSGCGSGSSAPEGSAKRSATANPNKGVESAKSAPMPDRPVTAGKHPNILYVLSDDQRAESIACMPKLRELMGPNAVTFKRHFAATPLCCPARSTILTGLYAHHHRVLANADIEEDDREERTNGALDFQKNGNEERVFPKWLQQVGYWTGIYGKYLNDYDDLLAATPRYVPPYWDDFHVFPQAAFYDFELEERSPGEKTARRRCFVSDVKTRKKQEKKCRKSADEVIDDGNENFSTDVLAERAITFIRQATKQGKPWFVYFAPWAPHSPYTSPARYQPDPAKAEFTKAAMDRLGNCSLFEWKDRPASFLEADVSDKPDWVQEAARKKHPADKLDDHRKEQLVSVLATEDAMESIFKVLDELGIKDDTIVVYHGDNGYAWGEHHHPAKNCTYEGCSLIPLMIRDPAVTHATAPLDALTVNIDIAPTFADWAGASAPKVDGLSLVKLLRGEAPNWPRQEVLTECWGTGKKGHADVQASVRTTRWKYVEHYDDPERTKIHVHSKGGPDLELYDLQADPFELDNLLRLDEAGLRRTGHTKAEVEVQRSALEKRLHALEVE